MAYATKVQYFNAKVKIIEFGFFTYTNGKWYFLMYTGKVFTAKNYEDSYECKDTVLTKKVCRDENNETAAHYTFETGLKFCYYIAIDEKQEKV